MSEGSKTVDHALTLLVELRDGGPGTVTELARRANLSRSAAGRLLTTLAAHGFARRIDARYDLGFAFLRFESRLVPGLRRAAAPELEALVSRFGETASVAARDRDGAVALAQVVPDQDLVYVRHRPGTRHALTVGAHGRCMLAADAKLELPDVDTRLIAELAEIARVGYAVSHDELEPGVSGLAAAIVEPDGRALGSIGVLAPSHRFPAVDVLAPAVVSAADAVSAALDLAPAHRHPAVAAFGRAI
jgi:DNA-binding IclR family transcriptional regulator